jgi:hypothetical protein
MSATWTCPKCNRSFRSANQRHRCGTGDRNDVLRNRPAALAAIYDSIESFAKSLGPVEIVTRERYVLLRSTRIFADLVVMTDAIRAAVHIERKVDDPMFFKVGDGGKRVTHVAKLRTQTEVQAILPYLKEAYELSLKNPLE